MAGKKSVTVSRVIPASQEDIWGILNDTRRYAEWIPQTIEVTQSGGQGVEGATYHERNQVFGPIKGDSRWRVVESTPQHSLHEGEGLPLVKNLSIAFDTQPAGESTEVTLTLRYDSTLGPIGALIDKAAHGQTVAAQEKALENLEALVVRESAAAREGQAV